MGWQPAAPVKAVRLLERWRFCRDHGWTFAEYDAADAGDIMTAREFDRLLADVERKAIEDAKQ